MKAALKANWPFPSVASSKDGNPRPRRLSPASSMVQTQAVRVTEVSDLSLTVTRVGHVLGVVACGLLTAGTMADALREITERHAAQPFTGSVFDMRRVVNCLSASELTDCSLAEFKRSGISTPISYVISQPDHQVTYDHCWLCVYELMYRAVFLTPARAFAWAGRRQWSSTIHFEPTQKKLAALRGESMPKRSE